MDTGAFRPSEHSGGFVSVLARDYGRVYPDRSWRLGGHVKALFFHPGLVAVLLLRIQNALHLRGNRRIAGLIRSVNFFITGADFVLGCRVGPGLQLTHPSGVVVGYMTVIGENCTLMQQVTLGQKNVHGSAGSGNPLLADDVVISAGAKVLGCVTIGRGAVVGANSVVLDDVPDGAIAVGVPAVVKQR